MPDSYGSIRNIPQSVPLGRLAAILQYAKEVAAALAARQDQPMWSAVGRLAELGLARAPETVENYSYGFPPKTEAGPFGVVNPANFELAGLAPVGTAAKGLALAGKGALAAGKGLAAIPFMGTTKGLTEALTKVEPTVDAFAAMKDLAHSYMGTPPLTAAHPAIAHLPAQDQQAVIDWQKLFQTKYDIWKGPEEHATYLAGNKQPPSSFSFEEYPPGWADKVQAKFDELIGPAAGQGPATSTLAGASPATSSGPATYPLSHWKMDPHGHLQTAVETPNAMGLQAGWDNKLVTAKDWTPGATYAEHSLGSKILQSDTPGDFFVTFPDSPAMKGPFASALDAKHFHQDAESAGLIAPAGQGPATGAKGPAANPKMGQFTPEELAAQQGPVGTTGGPGPAGAAGGSEQLAAVQELRDKYGVTQEEVKMWLEYEPQMTPKKILERYTEAEQAFAKGGMAAEQYRDPDIRATALGALPYELARGSYRQNPVPTAPITAPAGAAMRTSNSTGWAHPWLFTSDVPSGAQYYQSYPHQMENLRALTEEGRIFRPDRIKANPDAPITHEFEQAYDFLKAQEAAGRPFPAEYKPRPGETKIFESTGKEVVDRWRTSGHNAGYSHIERPDVAITLQQMGMRGFTTHERGGTNYAFFHDVPLRWYKAPFDPRKRSIPGYFLGPAAAGAGSALLARELLLQHAGQGEEQ